MHQRSIAIKAYDAQARRFEDFVPASMNRSVMKKVVAKKDPDIDSVRALKIHSSDFRLGWFRSFGMLEEGIGERNSGYTER